MYTAVFIPQHLIISWIYVPLHDFAISGRSSLSVLWYTRHISTMISSIGARCVQLVLNIRRSHQNQLAIHGCYQRNCVASLRLDHAISFMGTNGLVLMDPYLKYPWTHPKSCISTKTTTYLLEEDSAHFDYSHTLVKESLTTFLWEEFYKWCCAWGIKHLTRAPHHPVANDTAAHLVQTFRQSLWKSSLLPELPWRNS